MLMRTARNRTKDEIRDSGSENRDSGFEIPASARLRRGRRDSRLGAAALMLSLWALFLLSAMVISWALEIDSRLAISGNANRSLEAEAMACSGVEVALHPLVTPASPNLNRQMDRRESYETHITGEGGRLNINWIVAGEDPNKLELLRRYLENKGIDLNERNVMIDSLLDWVSPNTGLHHLNAPPETDDYHPTHSLLTRIEELKRVAGWDQFTSQPGWDEDFTLNSTGPIDLVWASHDVLMTLPGMNDELVSRFLVLRRGPDGIDGTADDAPFKSLDDVRAALGLSPEQFQELGNLISFRDPVFRIVSIGKSGDVTRLVQAVVRKVNNVPQMITWKEL
jgi:hypothetical protein